MADNIIVTKESKKGSEVPAATGLASAQVANTLAKSQPTPFSENFVILTQDDQNLALDQARKSGKVETPLETYTNLNPYFTDDPKVKGTNLAASLPKPTDRKKQVADKENSRTVATAAIDKSKNTFKQNSQEIMNNGLVRSREPIVIVPKKDLICQLFLVPTWDSNERNTIVTENAAGTTVLNKSVYSTTEFFLEAVQEQDAEKYQIVETFGENKIYFYGTRPKVYSFSGILLNTDSHPWKRTFLEKYDQAIRGTKCSEQKRRVYLVYDDVLAEGYILNISTQTSASTPNSCPFAFTMFITNIIRTAIASPYNEAIPNQ